MKRPFLLLFCAAALTSNAACSSDSSNTNNPTTDAGQEDSGMVNADAAEPDGGTAPDAMTTNPDAAPTDTGTPDSGMVLLPQMEPGAYVQVAEGRVAIGQTFAVVKQTLGEGTRTAATGARSYEWTLSGDVGLTVWFANSTLSTQNDVSDSDVVLWIAVTNGFTGKTSKGIGIGSTRAEVEAEEPTGYGGAPHEIPLDNPTGTLAQYFTNGFLVAYDDTDVVRTFTVCRSYPQAPDGIIDVTNALLDFGASQIQGFRTMNNLPQLGSHLSDVETLLGMPDGIGTVMVSGQSLQVVSYGFIGIEIFTTITPGLERVLFVSVHAPYYGTIGGTAVGIGSSRGEVEDMLGLGTGVSSTQNARFVCYEGGEDPDVSVTYAEDETAQIITVPLIRAADSMTCP